MKTIIDKHEIIRLMQQNDPNREIASLIGFDRKTVAHYWRDTWNKQAVSKKKI